MVKVNGLFAVMDDTFIDDVEHFEEGCFFGDALRAVSFDATFRLRSVLTPDFECEVEICHNVKLMDKVFLNGGDGPSLFVGADGEMDVFEAEMLFVEDW